MNKLEQYKDIYEVGDVENSELQPLRDWFKQTSLLHSTKNNISIEQAHKDVQEQFSQMQRNDDIKNPYVKHTYQNEHGDFSVKETKLTDYIAQSFVEDDVIIPSFTRYCNPSVKRGIYGEYMIYNTGVRKTIKRAMFKHEENLAVLLKKKEEGEKGLEDKIQQEELQINITNVGQKGAKTNNNSITGQANTTSSPIYRPSVHYALTSITRFTSSTGNLITESMNGGTKALFRPYDVYNYIGYTLNCLNTEEIREVINEFNVHVPTTEDLVNMFKHSTDHYFKDEGFYNKVREILNNTSEEGKVFLMYANDLYHLRVHNDKLMRDMMDMLVNHELYDVEIPEEYKIEDEKEYKLFVSKHMLFSKMLGKASNLSQLSKTDFEIYQQLRKTTLIFSNTLLKYQKLIRAFFVSKAVPINVAFTKYMTRTVINLSDTDSTCSTYQDWVSWYFNGDLSFNDKSITVAIVISSFISQALRYQLKVFSSNMNVEKKEQGRLSMKTEFFWYSFISVISTKHYIALTASKEASMYVNPLVEIKGVNLKVKSFSEEVNNMAMEFYKKLLNIQTGEVDVEELTNEVIKIEKTLIDKIHSGDTSLLKRSAIKDKDTYTNDVATSHYFYHVLWNEVFGEKYGEAPIPEYTSVDVPVSLNTKNKINAFIENIEDVIIKNKFRNFMSKFPKKASISTFKIPAMLVSSNGIPEEIKKVMDIQRIVKGQISNIYILMRGINAWKNDNTLFIDEKN